MGTSRFSKTPEATVANSVVSGEELRQARMQSMGTAKFIALRKDKVPKRLSKNKVHYLQRFYRGFFRHNSLSEIKPLYSSDLGDYKTARRIYSALGGKGLKNEVQNDELDSAYQDAGMQNLIVAGTSCSGKSTHGSLVAATLGWTIIEADDLVHQAYFNKMNSDTPPTTEDRLPTYVTALNVMHALNATGKNVVMVFPAQKKVYRDILRTVKDARILFLQAEDTQLIERARSRTNHAIIRSDQCEEFIANQVQIAEIPSDRELSDTAVVSTGESEEEVQRAIERQVSTWLGLNS